MSKYLLITTEYPPVIGGVASYYSALVKNWPRKNELLVLTNKITRGKNYSDENAWQVKRRALLLSWFWPKWIRLFWLVPKIIKREGVTTLMVGQVLPLGYTALLVKKFQKVPYIVLTHGLDILLPQENKWKKYWLLKILNGAKLLVANSQFTKNELLKLGFADKKIKIVYPTVDPQVFKPILKETQTSTPLAPYILSVGRLVRRKGFDSVIEVLPRIIRHVPGIKYLIAGRGPDKEYLLDKARQNGVSERVIFLEHTSDERLLALYQQASAVAMPYRQIGADAEGFGIVLLEAAACGKPVVVGNSGGAPEAVKHGYSGFLVNPESSEELAQALIKILTDEEFSQRLGKYGRQMVLEKFVAEREIANLWQRLV